MITNCIKTYIFRIYIKFHKMKVSYTSFSIKFGWVYFDSYRLPCTCHFMFNENINEF